jgi:putative hydrolase of the HAD superfamily
MFDAIAFDADDTLWHNETLYARAESRLAALLAAYAGEHQVRRKLLETEEVNLRTYGYGIKGFALSMIETAVDLSAGKITGSEIREIIGFTRDMLTAPVSLIDGVENVVRQLARSYRLMVITKGDLLDQRSKLARSKIGHHFQDIEVVSEKSVDTYRTILERYHILPERFMMVGNSSKSDIVPVLAIGGYAVHIPYQITWVHEQVPQMSADHDQYFTVDRMAQLPGLINDIGKLKDSVS